MNDLWNRRTLAVIVLVSGAAVAAAAQPDRGPGGHWMRAGDPIQGALARLTLTADQQAKTKAIVDDETVRIAALRDQVGPARDALDAAAHAANPDPATVGKAYLKVVAAEDAIRAESAKYHDAVAAALTEDQKSQFEGYLSSFRDGRGHWGGARAGAPRSF